MARARRRLARASCCRSPTCARGSTGTREGDRLRDALLADLEATLRPDRPRRDASRVEHRMTPMDFARELGAVWGNAFAVEPTLHQSAYFRPPNRDRRRRAGCTSSGGGTHPGAGMPGVLLGAEVTARAGRGGRAARQRGVRGGMSVA